MEKSQLAGESISELRHLLERLERFWRENKLAVGIKQDQRLALDKLKRALNDSE